MKDIKLLLSDVDGTIVNQDKVLLPSTKDAVKRLRASGISVSMVSGRPPRGMKFLIDELGIQTPFGGFNGGALVAADLSPITSQLLEPNTAKEAYDSMTKAGLDVWVYTETDWLIADPKAAHVTRETHTVRFEAKVVSNPGESLDRVIKLVGVSDDHALVARCDAELQTSLKGRAAASRSQPYYLDVTHPAAVKGATVHMLAKHLGISPKQIATIGDGPNDASMFPEGGLSVAMGNASAEVKAAANCVTGSFNDNGWAEAVDRFILA